MYHHFQFLCSQLCFINRISAMKQNSYVVGNGEDGLVIKKLLYVAFVIYKPPGKASIADVIFIIENAWQLVCSGQRLLAGTGWNRESMHQLPNKKCIAWVCMMRSFRDSM